MLPNDVQEIARLKKEKEDLHHRLSQYADAISELAAGRFPPGFDMFQVSFAGQVFAVPPDKIYPLWGLVEKKLFELGEWSTWRQTRQDLAEARETIAALEKKLRENTPQ